MTKPARHATRPQGPSPLPDAATVEARKAEARTWFEGLRDRICAAFEKIEDVVGFNPAKGKSTTLHLAVIRSAPDASTARASSGEEPLVK